MIVEREPLALVITDLRLPDGDGLELVRAAWRLPTPTPSIVVTGFASEASRMAALAAGASGYLAKPFAAASFISLVEKVLDSPKQL
jgi:DNA-binding response OmpR family regulator